MQGQQAQFAHCWAKYYGRLTKAIYVAETPDAEWFLLRFRGLGTSRNFDKWTPAKDITEWFDRPTAVIRERKAVRRQAYGPRYGEAAQAQP